MEYCVIVTGYSQSFNNQLNTAAEDGWRLHSFHTSMAGNDTIYTAVMQRETPEKKDVEEYPMGRGKSRFTDLRPSRSPSPSGDETQ